MLTLIFTLMMDELNLVVNFRFQFTTLNLNIISYRFFSLKQKNVLNCKKLLLKQIPPHVNTTEQMIFGQAA